MKSLRYVPYSKNQVEFDAYDAKTRDEKVPSAAKAKKVGRYTTTLIPMPV